MSGYKANGLNPEAYLNHLLTVLPERFAADPLAVVDDLLPWADEMQLSFRVKADDGGTQCRAGAHDMDIQNVADAHQHEDQHLAADALEAHSGGQLVIGNGAHDAT